MNDLLPGLSVKLWIDHFWLVQNAKFNAPKRMEATHFALISMPRMSARAIKNESLNAKRQNNKCGGKKKKNSILPHKTVKPFWNKLPPYFNEKVIYYKGVRLKSETKITETLASRFFTCGLMTDDPFKSLILCNIPPPFRAFDLHIRSSK